MDALTSHERPIFPMRVNIGTERWVSIRPIARADASALSDFYARLSPESRRCRFLSCGSAPAALVPRLAAAAGFVGILREPGPLDGAIVAHASLLPDAPGSAEAAFTVADDLQHHGLGKRLVALVLELAAALRLGRVAATMLVDNVSMRHLLVDAGHPVVADRIDAGVEEIVLDSGAAPLLAA